MPETSMLGDKPVKKEPRKRKSTLIGPLHSLIESIGDVPPAVASPSLISADEEAQESQPLLPDNSRSHQGELISPHRAVTTLAKSMFNAGCFSLPYAWKMGGLWVSLVMQCLITGLNWYGNHILVRSAQHLAKKSNRPSLDYGHFAKKVFDYSEVQTLKRNSKRMMYLVNITILFYQLGMGSVAVLFIAKNLQKVSYDLWSFDLGIPFYTAIAFIAVLSVNLLTGIRAVSVFAAISTVFFLTGTLAILIYCTSRNNLWQSLPASTDFRSTVIFFGMAMYSYEGQTMILPIENKLRHPEDFLNNCGVLPTTMLLCASVMTSIGFYGYTAMGADTAETITLNLPSGGVFTAINICLMMQAIFGHAVIMYVVFDMFWNGFLRKINHRLPSVRSHAVLVDKAFRFFWVFVTYLMAAAIPKLDILIPVVGITSGTLCALVFPPTLEVIAFWQSWKISKSPWWIRSKLAQNASLAGFGILAVIAGIYANSVTIIQAFGDDYYASSVVN